VEGYKVARAVAQRAGKEQPKAMRSASLSYVEQATKERWKHTAKINKHREVGTESGAVFEAEKTAFIHFVRPLQPDRGPASHLVFGNKTIAPKQTVKILAVTLDSGLSTCVESRSESDREVHGFAGDPWRPTGADAPDVYRSCGAHNGLRDINVVCTVTYLNQKACNDARTGTTTCRKTDPARVQVRGNAHFTERSQATVGERQATRTCVEPHDQAVQPCAEPPTAAMHIVVPAARRGVS